MPAARSLGIDLKSYPEWAANSNPEIEAGRYFGFIKIG